MTDTSGAYARLISSGIARNEEDDHTILRKIRTVRGNAEGKSYQRNCLLNSFVESYRENSVRIRSDEASFWP
jgi:hypothetical protein